MPETMLRGEAYVSQSVKTFYRHYDKVANTLHDVSGRNMIKVQQLLTYAYKEQGLEPEHRNEQAVNVHHAI
eukprot:5360685-Pleurochrysis_carterae.AAC.1